MYNARLAMYGGMMADNSRNAALIDAIGRLVRPGDVVIDVGAGVGFLSVAAAKAGAARVFSIEQDAIMVALAHRVVAENGYVDAIQIVHAHSSDWTPPERADLLICETIGFALFDEGFAATIADARARFAKPDARIIPGTLSLHAAPVSRPSRVFHLENAWETCGIALQPLAKVLRNCFQRVDLTSADVIATPKCIARFDVAHLPPDPHVSTTVQFRIGRPATLSGLAVWFELDLGDGVRLSSGPENEGNHWGQVFLSAERAQAVAPGTEVSGTLSMRSNPNATRFEWAMEAVSA